MVYREKGSNQGLEGSAEQLRCSVPDALRASTPISPSVRWLPLRFFSSAAERRKICHMNFRVEIEQEEDGRWIAEVVDLPGVLAYGSTSKEAQAKVQALALRVVADRLEHGEAGPDLVSISFAAA